MSEPRLVSLDLGEPPGAWAAAGFDVQEERFSVDRVELRCGDGSAEGVRSWTLAGEGMGDVDGLPTRWVNAVPTSRSGATTSHPNHTVAVDHVVIGSPNRDRTIAAFERVLGLQPRRQTEHELYGRAMVQTFFLLAPTLIEVISRPDAEGEGPCAFWGLAFVSDDLDATAGHLGDACSPPKDAVQRGRRIATLRREAVGLTTNVAFMTPRVAG